MVKSRILIVVWILAYLYIPCLIIGNTVQMSGVVGLVVGFIASPLYLIIIYLAHSIMNMEARRAFTFLVITFLVSMAFELLGVNYGIPFGKYYYTQGLGPKVYGVPILIPLLWSSLGYFTLIAYGDYVLSALGMVVLDVTFDPLLSGPIGLWHWVTRGQFFGVPLINFLGWFVVSITFYLIYARVMRVWGYKPSIIALLFYDLYDIDWAITDAFYGLMPVALISTVLLIIFNTMVILRLRRCG
ncbi:carotenoid biosynthesis protein [Caldivirga maquilingensis]|uniref:Membrane protein-like protein n=1 Tax=Caldivirga maquilingensis (strain ATCC 700844 / DSM 13496 / JCM 10307 / IC-167) TaxID=397948 RepID=A8MA24_CALMQ|nr:carotenoid biosynthesis protein [Caldivirga maquilingensis]ABW00956.1 membrane protein-like protein [Caldivirga maquilingensis IC-167]